MSKMKWRGTKRGFVGCFSIVVAADVGVHHTLAIRHYPSLFSISNKTFEMDQSTNLTVAVCYHNLFRSDNVDRDRRGFFHTQAGVVPMAPEFQER